MNRGNPAENRTASILEGFGYFVGSMRHRKGPGDLLAIPYGGGRPLLIEVKKTTDYPWRSTWGPEKRADMISAAYGWDMVPLLAWWPWAPKKDAVPIFLPPEDWPL